MSRAEVGGRGGLLRGHPTEVADKMSEKLNERCATKGWEGSPCQSEERGERGRKEGWDIKGLGPGYVRNHTKTCPNAK